METAARYGIRTVTVVNNNNALGQCVPDLQTVFTDSEQCARRYEFTPVSFTKIAAEMGFYAQRVTEAQEVAAALRSAFASNKPALIEAITDSATPTPQPK
jgi:acetolactate synthase-1/2/3 large subunit